MENKRYEQGSTRMVKRNGLEKRGEKVEMRRGKKTILWGGGGGDKCKRTQINGILENGLQKT